MEVTLMVAAPMLLVALVIGLVVSIFQAATHCTVCVMARMLRVPTEPSALR